jgi:hypothetical protein
MTAVHFATAPRRVLLTAHRDNDASKKTLSLVFMPNRSSGMSIGSEIHLEMSKEGMTGRINDQSIV